MSTAKHHNEWLSLIDISGPFLSLPVLTEVFPQGLEVLNADLTREVRAAYQEWEDNLQERRPDLSIHRAWIEHILKELLGYKESFLLTGQGIPEGIHATVAEHGETLRPEYVLATPPGKPDAGKPRLLVNVYPAEQGLDKPLQRARWKASPSTRMMELLHATNVRLGLITNGRQWMLVNAPRGETTGYISWYSNLLVEEPITLKAFYSVLQARRFFGVAEGQTLEAMLKSSAENQQEVTDRLGYQVRKALEVFVQTLDRIDKDRNRNLLVGVNEKELYQAALTVMMRLVFLLSAEERELLLLGDPIYDQHYAVSTLRAKLREEADQNGEEILERRSDAWCRLLATFRAVYGGIEHDLLRLNAYGGSLFNPDRFPFLEGRARFSSWKEVEANPIPVDNRTVLHLLEALQILQMKAPGGGYEPRRLSFRSLDVEQIGHVYEGLLDHTAKRAETPVLSLVGAKDLEPEVSLDELEAKKNQSEDTLIEFLKDVTKRSEAALRKAVAAGSDATKQPDALTRERLLRACDNDEAVFNRILPFLALVRVDTHGDPVVIMPGSMYVTDGEDRRTTGTHYTPRSLTKPIVQHTLEPLVYDGVAEGKPNKEWKLKTASELLNLKVCDIAMGSGAFLVETCRYLSERLVEAWEEVEKANPGKVVVAPEGTLSESRPDECPIPADADERLTVARRIIADRCLYGVDVNSMAVEMAKLSLWLITLQKHRPFTFLDHALRYGDSLLGVTNVEQIEYFDLNPGAHTQIPFASSYLKEQLAIVIAKREELERFTVSDITDLERKQTLLREADEALDRVRVFGDLLIGDELRIMQKVERERQKRHWEKSEEYSQEENESEQLQEEVIRIFSLLSEAAEMETYELQAQAKALLGKRKPFHWALEFPEVFKRGFDAIVGNPPFIGGKKITGALGTDYRHFMIERLANSQRGNADLSAYFFLRAHSLLRHHGCFGLVATNTIAQGDTREVGLDQLTDQGKNIIYRAIPSTPWPGEASLEVAYVWIHRGIGWEGNLILNDQKATGITSFLVPATRVSGKPFQLVANADKSFQGSIVLGMGFVLTPDEATELIAKDARNRDVLAPYLNGEDLNTRPDQSPSRWVINFKDWPLDRDHAPTNYKGPVAADYPDCLKIVEQRVKPERTRKKENSDEYQLRYPLYEKWWIYADKRPQLYSTIKEMQRVLACPVFTKYLSFAWLPVDYIYMNKMYIFPFQDNSIFTLLSSNFHEVWTRQYSGTLETRLQYAPTDCFETFPFPQELRPLENIGLLYNKHRQSLMNQYQEGLTKIYNRFHLKKDDRPEIERLRELHVEMDKAVAIAYGWTDLNLIHGFHETKQGIRFTISENARLEVLDRLLELNHQRYADEVKQGLHEKGNKKKVTKGSAKKKAEGKESQIGLFN